MKKKIVLCVGLNFFIWYSSSDVDRLVEQETAIHQVLSVDTLL